VGTIVQGFVVITKLPRWVEYGAFCLSFLAGSVNAVGLLGFSHQAVSHLTGTTTLLGAAIQQGDLAMMLHLFLVIASFFVGAIFSGVLFENTALRLGRRYGVALLLECCLLLSAMLLLDQGHVTGQYVASMACGLQNAMISTYSGAVVRSTHVSGIFTDLGIMFGARLRGVPLVRRKVRIFGLLLGGFLSGGIAGTGLYGHYQYGALLMPALMCASLSLIYALYLRWLHRHPLPMPEFEHH
jgi:uncharacterized membrane protein YoaK (UPF0700 family)